MFLSTLVPCSTLPPAQCAKGTHVLSRAESQTQASDSHRNHAGKHHFYSQEDLSTGAPHRELLAPHIPCVGPDMTPTPVLLELHGGPCTEKRLPSPRPLSALPAPTRKDEQPTPVLRFNPSIPLKFPNYNQPPTPALHRGPGITGFGPPCAHQHSGPGCSPTTGSRVSFRFSGTEWTEPKVHSSSTASRARKAGQTLALQV